MTKIAIIGFGRMGKEITKLALESGMRVVAVVDKKGHPDIGKDVGIACGAEKAGIAVEAIDNLDKILKKTKPDVAIDFSSPDACTENSRIILAQKINMVIGTTGFTEKQINEINANVKKNNVGAVISPNMSIGINVFWNLVGNAARVLKDYDIEITEVHHNRKKDSPSGTALKTADIIASVLGKDLKRIAVYGRCGASTRKKGEIGIHSIRMGGVVGDHTVYFGNENEIIEITHRAQSRKAFAFGAIAAARFLKGKKGIYTMKEVLGLS